MPDPSEPEDTTTTDKPASGAVPADEPVEAVEDERTGEELGEIAGGGDVTDLGGDSPSS